jgi:uncharacterized protein YkwD
VSLVNAFRTARGLRALADSPALLGTAQAQAAAQAAAGFMSHGDPAARQDFESRMAAAGLGSVAGGECVGEGYADAAAAVAGWEGSATHRAILLLPGVTRAAAAVRNGEDGTPYWCLQVASGSG